MKNPFALVVILFLVNTLSAQQKKEITSGNPIIKGWYADPEAVVFKNKYWIFPTYSDKYKKQVFFDAFSSKDLITWRKHERILDTSNISWARMAMWAPAIVENENKYYLFFSANDIQNDKEYGGIGVAVADKPGGPYKDHLGKPLIDKWHNGAQPIDQFVFKDKDQYYIIYGGWQHCNIAKLNKDFTSVIPFNDGVMFKEITPAGYVEGPMMFIRNNKYYFMWSEGGWTGPDYSVAYAISDSPFGPFERVGKILQQDSTIATGAGHHSVMHDAMKDLWYIIYHRRPLGETAANNRVTCIEQMYFNEKGYIKKVELSMKGVKKQKLK